jgi:hypothetical protein
MMCPSTGEVNGVKVSFYLTRRMNIKILKKANSR